MENRKTSKDVQIGEKTYQVKKIDARSACWLFSFMAARSDGGLILSALGKCNRSEFNEIQTLALRQTFRLDTNEGNVFPVSVLAPDGSFSDSNLAEDTESVFKLTCESLLFNLDPFLLVSESKSPQPIS